jgi:hypothetical protein
MYRDVIFPDSSHTTLIRHWHGADTALISVNGPLGFYSKKRLQLILQGEYVVVWTGFN